MNKAQVAPYGSWKSPITSDLIVSATIGLGSIMLDRAEGAEGTDVYWTELRPAEGGRVVIVRRMPDGQTVDSTRWIDPHSATPYNARTRVHEYGGGSCLVHDGTIYFSNYADQRLYRQEPGGEPQPITPAEKLRYADGVIDWRRKRVICVREDHTVAGREAVNTLVSFALDGSDEKQQALASGNDFYATPRLSPDGGQLAWLTWNHPNMPWDGTELWVGEITEDGLLSKARCIAGSSDESIFQPEWSPAGILHFVSDRTGWWNLYRWDGDSATALCPMEAEFGLPQWVFGMSTYSFASSEKIICSYTRSGIWHLASLDTETGTLEEIETPYTTIDSPIAAGGRVYFLGGSFTEARALVQLDLETGRIEVLRRSSEITIDSAYLSIAEPIEFPTEEGLTAYGLFYAPRNPGYVAPEGDLPPLIVQSHGGPTGANTGMFNLGFQYWTSRGMAVLDVNYGGSTGYGRAYRERLAGKWGIVDVDDCTNGAQWLADQGRVDGNRLTITGGSAGGYTTLCAITFRDVFKAGASYYGVSDVEALARDTHKFESRYLDKLIGPYPERRDIYEARSPIHFTERIACPVIFFQGLEDQVVPPSQAETMVEALRAKGLPVAYLAFEGEQHGFRRAENIKRSLDAELYFYSRIFAFSLAEAVEAVDIENL
jgi:dipeptidyl aminopeptidase/acylaminoacyl peptidase